jgi:hypothetical protein
MVTTTMDVLASKVSDKDSHAGDRHGTTSGLQDAPAVDFARPAHE